MAVDTLVYTMLQYGHIWPRPPPNEALSVLDRRMYVLKGRADHCCSALPCTAGATSHLTLLMKLEQSAGLGTVILGQSPGQLWYLFSFLTNLHSRSEF